jgi:iron(III) transport system substrate-binding protein
MTALSPNRLLATLALSALTLALPPSAAAQEQVLNLYSARHYQTDEAMYSNFTKATGIKINRIEMDDAALLARLKAEGAASPADVALLVDAARLWRAEQDGLFSPVQSKLLNERIPAGLRGADSGSGSQWFGFSTRARVIVYDKFKVQPGDVDTYEKLADPRNKGKVCLRSGSHPYNLSLFGSLAQTNGDAQTEILLKGIVDNMARAPKGGDTDQIRAVASGECQIAVTNTYYYVRLMRSTKPEDKEVIAKTAVMWPNQATTGTHMNISGAAIPKHAKNRDAAVKFLEYLASNEAQAYFANGNNEFPVVAGVPLSNQELQSLGKFKAETVPVAQIGANTARVQQMLDRVNFK